MSVRWRASRGSRWLRGATFLLLVLGAPARVLNECCSGSNPGKEPGIEHHILMVANAAYIGLAAALAGHGAAWKHRLGEPVVRSTQVAVVALSLFHFVLIHYGPVVQLAGRWLLALHWTLPTPLLVPVTCFATYRLFGMSNRRALRRKRANWDEQQGTYVPYYMMVMKHSTLVFFMCLSTLVATGFSLIKLALQEDGTAIPLSSAIVVLLFTGPLRAIPSLKPSHDSSLSRSFLVPGANRVDGDQVVVPVFSENELTSVIIISLRHHSAGRGSSIHIERRCTSLSFTPYANSKNCAEALKRLLHVDPTSIDDARVMRFNAQCSEFQADTAERPMRSADSTDRFVQDFMQTFEVAARMFTEACSAHSISAEFAFKLHQCKGAILDSTELFDGNSTKLRALTLLVINTVLNRVAVNSVRDESNGYPLPKVQYPRLFTVAELMVWGDQCCKTEEFRQHDRIVRVSIPAKSSIHNLQLKNRAGHPYDMQQLDTMVYGLTSTSPHACAHELLLFLLLQRMAQNGDTRLVQMDTLVSGRDIAMYVPVPPSGMTAPVPRRLSGYFTCCSSLPSTVQDACDRDLSGLSKSIRQVITKHSGRQARTALQLLEADAAYTESQPADKPTLTIVPPDNVPVAWNAFCLIEQHVLSWMMTYMISHIVFILADVYFASP